MSFFKVKTNGYVSIIAIDRPPANALSQEVLKGLSDLLHELERDKEVRVIVLHGEGRFFCAGADIKEFTALAHAEDYIQLAKNGQDVFDYVENYPKPILAAIHGAALGGGLELAMSCHMRIVSETAKIGLPELQLGIIPGFGGTMRLPRYVGVGKACEMMLTSDPISGVEAFQLGLANYVCKEEEVLSKATDLAHKIANKSPISVEAVLNLLKFTNSDSFYKGIQREAELFGKAFSSNDAREGVAAFIEKRQPHFKGE